MKYKLLLSIFFIASLISLVFADPYDGMWGMMSGAYGMSFGILGWIFSLLIIVVLVLLIVWLIKQIEKNK